MEKTAKLTDKQEKFAQKFVETDCATTAYKHAFDTEGWKDKSIHENASKMKAKVTPRLDELRAEHKERHNVTVGSLTKELEESRELAKEEKQPSAMTGATMGKAKIHGLATDKSHLDIDLKGHITVSSILEEIDGSSAGLPEA